ncbi:MAG: hypothetical protein CMB18_04910 [Euryarchaeota archaeon]|nr:hypothetical protein [Euryarchaeota archaeon]
MSVDRVLLDQLYRARLMELRERAEAAGYRKNGSVEVLRARLIRNQVMQDHDLGWEGIQSMPHQELGEALKIFGIKSSGSHKERRQRLWLHLNHDSRRLTVENLAEMEREKLHTLCRKLELQLTGTRTVLMGRVAGVLASQGRGWGQIKRSLRRNGLPDVEKEPVKISQPFELEEEFIVVDVPETPIDFLQPISQHLMEDAADLLSKNDGKKEVPELKNLATMIQDIERMIGTILNSHGGRWSEQEEELFLRIAIRRGWQVEDELVSTRLLLVAGRIAEAKGSRETAFQELGATPVTAPKSSMKDSDAISRIRAKMTEAEQIISGLR